MPVKSVDCTLFGLAVEIDRLDEAVHNLKLQLLKHLSARSSTQKELFIYLLRSASICFICSIISFFNSKSHLVSSIISLSIGIFFLSL